MKEITQKIFGHSLISSQSQELEDWSKGRDPEDIISVGYTPNGAIYVFYWAEDNASQQ